MGKGRNPTENRIRPILRQRKGKKRETEASRRLGGVEKKAKKCIPLNSVKGKIGKRFSTSSPRINGLVLTRKYSNRREGWKKMPLRSTKRWKKGEGGNCS